MVRKVKAHTTLAAVTAGLVDPRDKAGNDAADLHAKAGARSHPVDEAATRRCLQSAKVVTTIAMYLARLVVAWRAEGAHDTTPKAERPVRRRRTGTGGRRIAKPTQHVIVRVGGRHRCMRCHRSGAKPSHIRGHRCVRSRGHRLLQASTGLVYCAVCGAYSRRCVRLLRGPCRRRRSVAGRRALLQILAGRCPSSGRPLGPVRRAGIETFSAMIGGVSAELEVCYDEADEEAPGFGPLDP